MTWAQLTAHRERLGLTEVEMARLVLRCSPSTYNGWGARGKVPPYASASVENFLMNSEKGQQALMAMRRKELGL
jgi:hypothetical protein